MVSLQPELKLKGNFDDIFNEYIRLVSDSELTVEIVKSLLFTLTLTRKGLTARELSKMVNISESKWQHFTKYFSFAML